MEQDMEINLRSPSTWVEILRALDRAGGLPVVVLPLCDGKVIAQGFGCRTGREFIEALRWAYRNSPDCRVRMIPADIQPAC